MQRVAHFEIKGNRIEIFRLVETKLDNGMGGGKPWLRTGTYQSTSYRWHVNGEYASTFTWSDKKPRQEMLKDQFERMHKELFK